MTGRELISYILNNRLENAEIEGLEELSFEIPVRNVFVYHEDNTEDTIDYRPYSGSIYHVYDDGRTAEFIDIKEAFAIRGIETGPTYENVPRTGGIKYNTWTSGRYPWDKMEGKNGEDN